MTILVIGGTGQIGSLVVEELTDRGVEVRVSATKAPPNDVPSDAERRRKGSKSLQCVESCQQATDGLNVRVVPNGRRRLSGTGKTP